MHAAKRAGTIVATIDRDFEFLAEAFVRVTGYNPAKVLEYYPGKADLKAFRAAITVRGSQPDIN